MSNSRHLRSSKWPQVRPTRHTRWLASGAAWPGGLVAAHRHLCRRGSSLRRDERVRPLTSAGSSDGGSHSEAELTPTPSLLLGGGGGATNTMSLSSAELLLPTFWGALVLKGTGDGRAAIFSHIKDRNPFNYGHANLHLAKTANYMSGGHSVIQNNCRRIFIYSLWAPPPQSPWLQLERVQADLHWVTAHPCECES